MNKGLQFKYQRIAAWSGFVVMIVVGICFFSFAKVQPPLSPTMEPDGIKEFLIANRSGILWSVVLISFVVPLEYLFVVTTSWQMNRIEGGWGLLSMTQLLTGVVAPIGFMYPLFVLATAAYRAEERSPEILSVLTDLFYFMYVGFALVFVLQVVAIGIAVMSDKRSTPIFPRWFGYLNFFLGVVLAPGVFIFVVQDGPLAWNGLFAFWLPSFAYLLWKVSTPLLLLKAVKSEEAEHKASVTAETASRV
ncbi:hypothetical protein BH93_19735 [Rhodococcoides fascians A25f]|uniref:hypothetical protein n=1 Tax=Rhodococcoides fascians TaxID=1828 RepID=UPI00056747ED|nr:hypothetical protein [Rhodococcus fascians]QII07297.1 hypothetical protein BH93_19735 [Rhodococcus fascians A25f]